MLSMKNWAVENHRYIAIIFSFEGGFGLAIYCSYRQSGAWG